MSADPSLSTSILASMDLRDPPTSSLTLPPNVPFLDTHAHDTFTFETDISDPATLLTDLDVFFKSCYDIDSVISPLTLSVQGVLYSAQTCSRTSFECFIFRSAAGIGTHLFVRVKLHSGSSCDFYTIFQDIYFNFALLQRPQPTHQSNVNSNGNQLGPNPHHFPTGHFSNSLSPAPLHFSRPMVLALTPEDLYPSLRQPTTPTNLKPLHQPHLHAPTVHHPSQQPRGTNYFNNPQSHHRPTNTNDTLRTTNLATITSGMPLAQPHPTGPSKADGPTVEFPSASGDNRESSHTRPSLSAGSILRLRGDRGDERDDSLIYPSTARTTQSSLSQTLNSQPAMTQGGSQHPSDPNYRDSLIYRMSGMTTATDADKPMEPQTGASKFGNRTSLDLTPYLHRDRQALTREIRDAGGLVPKQPDLPPGAGPDIVPHQPAPRRTVQRRASLLFSPGTHTFTGRQNNTRPNESTMLPPLVDNRAAEGFAEYLAGTGQPTVQQHQPATAFRTPTVQRHSQAKLDAAVHGGDDYYDDGRGSTMMIFGRSTMMPTTTLHPPSTPSAQIDVDSNDPFAADELHHQPHSTLTPQINNTTTTLQFPNHFNLPTGNDSTNATATPSLHLGSTNNAYASKLTTEMVLSTFAPVSPISQRSHIANSIDPSRLAKQSPNHLLSDNAQHQHSGSAAAATSSPFSRGQFTMTFEWAVGVICSCLDDVERCFPHNSVTFPSISVSNNAISNSNSATNSLNNSPASSVSHSQTSDSSNTPSIAGSTNAPLSTSDLEQIHNTFKKNRKFLPQHVVPMLIQGLDALSSKFLEQIHQEIPTTFREFALLNGIPVSVFANLDQSSLDTPYHYEPRPDQLQRLLLKLNKSLNFVILNQNIQLRISLLQFYGKVVQTRIGLAQLHSVLLNPFWFLKALVNIHAPHAYVYLPPNMSPTSPPPSSLASPNSASPPPTIVTNNNINNTNPTITLTPAKSIPINNSGNIVKSPSSPSVSNASVSAAQSHTSTSISSINGTFNVSLDHQASPNVFALIRKEVHQTVQMLRVDQVLPVSSFSNSGAPGQTDLSLEDHDLTQDIFQLPPDLVRLGEMSILDRREIIRLLIEIYYRILPWYRSHLINLHQTVLLKGIQLRQQHAAAKHRSKKRAGDEFGVHDDLLASSSGSTSFSANTRSGRDSNEKPPVTEAQPSRPPKANDGFENIEEDEGLVLKPLSLFTLSAAPVTKGIDVAQVDLNRLPSQQPHASTDNKSNFRSWFRRDKGDQSVVVDVSTTPRNGESTPKNGQLTPSSAQTSLNADRPSMQAQPSIIRKSSLLSRIFSFKKDDSLDDEASLSIEPSTLTSIADQPISDSRPSDSKGNQPDSSDGDDDSLRLAQQEQLGDESDGSQDHPDLYDEGNTRGSIPAYDRDSATRSSQAVSTGSALGSFNYPDSVNDPTSSHDAAHLYDITKVFAASQQSGPPQQQPPPLPFAASTASTSTTPAPSHPNPLRPAALSTPHSATESDGDRSHSNSHSHHKTSLNGSYSPSITNSIVVSQSGPNGPSVDITSLQQYINLLNCQSISLQNGVPTFHYRSPLIDNVMLLHAQLFASQKTKSRELKVLQSHLGHLEDIFLVLLKQFQSFTGDDRFVQMQIQEMILDEKDRKESPGSTPSPSPTASSQPQQLNANDPPVQASQQFSKRYLAFLQNDFAL